MTESGTPQEPLRALNDDLRALVASEVRAVRGDAVRELKQARRASVLLGAAGGLGLLAAGTSAALMVRILDELVPRPASAAIVTVLLAGGAGALAAAGAAELRRTAAEAGRTVESVRQDLRPAGS